MALITAQLPFDFQVTGATQSNQYLMLKNSQQAYLLDASMTLTLISDADYPGWNVNAVTSITRSGTTATVTTASATNIPNGSTVTIAGASQTEYNGDHVVTVTGATTFTFTLVPSSKSVTSITRSSSTATATVTAHGYSTGNKVVVSGASQTEYNGEFTITVTGTDTFTYTVSGTPATPATGTITCYKVPVTPATGTITATGGITTVPGIVFLDGYFFVMDENAKIYGCELNTPTDWNALNFISAIKEPGAGKAIAKSQNYVNPLSTGEIGDPTAFPASKKNSVLHSLNAIT